MDIKIKKDSTNGDEKNLDIPQFRNSDEINKELDSSDFKKYGVSPKKTMRLNKNEDDLHLTTQFITTEFNTDDFETLEVDTLDLKNDIKTIETEYEKSENSRKEQSKIEDTIKVKNVEYEKVDLEIPKEKKQLRINVKHLVMSIIGLILLIVLVIIGIYFYQQNSAEKQLERMLAESITIDDVNVYGESVNFITEDPLGEIVLHNMETEEEVTESAEDTIDTQYHFDDVAVGNYYITSGERLITIGDNPDISYQTITRDGTNKDITITSTEKNIVNVEVANSDKQQVDILIDPSQGGIQGITASDYATTEQQLSLEYAKALQSELEALGYNVALTREDDSVPGGCDYQDTYCSDGRIAMAYSLNPKLYIGLGFNGTDGSGFEIFDSVNNSHTLAELLKTNLESVLTPSERTSDQVEPGIFNKVYESDNGDLDYLYAIRETGGAIMNSDNENTDAIALNTNKVGAESLVLDLGYISNGIDFYNLDEETEVTAVAKAIANAIDQYVNS